MGKTLPLTQRDESQWHLLDVEQSLARLDSDADRGLSQSGARQRLLEYGPNRLQESRLAGLIDLFLDQFRDLCAARWPLPDTARLGGGDRRGRNQRPTPRRVAIQEKVRPSLAMSSSSCGGSNTSP